MKKIAILYSEYTPLVDSIKYQLSDCIVDCFTDSNNIEDYDMVVISRYSGIYDGEALTCHYSLLPAFDCDEPVKEAVCAGVKVTGITIYYAKSKKIVAQYPVFINNNTHYDELKQELVYIEQVLFPLVINKIVKNEPFEVNSLLNKSCGGSCGGCSSCSH